MISTKRDWDAGPRGLWPFDESEVEEPPNLLRSLRALVAQALRAAYSNKCVYCESPLGESEPVIGYYRPPKLYPWLKNEWSNLLAVCSGCNRKLRTDFPVASDRVTEYPGSRDHSKPDSALLQAEQPLLLHPDLDRPEEHIEVLDDGTLAPRNGSKRGHVTIELCDLNRDVLQNARLAHLNFLDTHAFTVRIPDVDNGPSYLSIAVKLFRTATKASAPYTLTARSTLFALEQSSDDPALASEEKARYRALFNALRLSEHTLMPEPSFPGENHREPTIPVAIEQLRVAGFHGINDAPIALIPANTPWVLLTGENGFGKTSLLRAIAIGLNGVRDGDTVLAEITSKISLQFRFQGRSHLNHLHDEDFLRLTKFAAYGASRLQVQGRESQDSLHRKSSPTYSLFNDDGRLMNIEPWLLESHHRSVEEYEQIKQHILTVLPYLADICVEDDPIERKRLIRYVERDPETGESFEPVEFRHLASGNKSALAMVGDMWMRLSRRHRGELDPHRLSGIVLIDELDNHMHPKWQRQLPSLLSCVFPQVQFIASTHSLIPCLGTPRDSVFLKVSRTREAGTQVERLDIDIGNLLPNSILTSPLFGLEKIIPEANTQLSALHTEDSYQEIEEQKRIREALEAFEASDHEFPEALFEQQLAERSKPEADG